MMKIRAAKLEDIQQLMKLEMSLFNKWDELDPIDKVNIDWFSSESHRKHLTSVLEDSKNKIFVLVDKQNIVGYVKAHLFCREPFLEKVGYISDLFVENSYRSQGIGKKLVEEAIKWFKQKNLKWTTTSTHLLDSKAINFWKKRGYEEFNTYFKMRL